MWSKSIPTIANYYWVRTWDRDAKIYDIEILELDEEGVFFCTGSPEPIYPVELKDSGAEFCPAVPPPL